MVRALNWSEEEFQILVNHPWSSDEELITELPLRSKGAIDVVRAGIHSFHTEGDISILSQMMCTYLKERASTLICPQCGKVLKQS